MAEDTTNKATRVEKDAEITKLQAHDIELERSNNEKIAVEGVYDHELDILRAIHGQDRVTIKDSYEVEVENADAAAEYERLKRKYNRRDVGQDQIVQSVLGPNPKELAKQMGVKFNARDVKLPQAENVDKRDKTKVRKG